MSEAETIKKLEGQVKQLEAELEKARQRGTGNGDLAEMKAAIDIVKDEIKELRKELKAAKEPLQTPPATSSDEDSIWD